MKSLSWSKKIKMETFKSSNSTKIPESINLKTL